MMYAFTFLCPFMIYSLALVSSCLGAEVPAAGSPNTSELKVEEALIPKPFPLRKPGYEEIRKEWDRFFAVQKSGFPTRIHQGMEKGADTGTMIASWMRYGHVWAVKPGYSAALFSQEFNTWLSNQKGMRGSRDDGFSVLYTFFKMYYHADLKYSRDDHRAFLAVKEAYRPLITEKHGVRVFDEGKGIRLFWKVENGAWRLDRLEAGKH